jgi:hypothetical protein
MSSSGYGPLKRPARAHPDLVVVAQRSTGNDGTPISRWHAAHAVPRAQVALTAA